VGSEGQAVVKNSEVRVRLGAGEVEGGGKGGGVEGVRGRRGIARGAGRVRTGGVQQGGERLREGGVNALEGIGGRGGGGAWGR